MSPCSAIRSITKTGMEAKEQAGEIRENVEEVAEEQSQMPRMNLNRWMEFSA